MTSIFHNSAASPTPATAPWLMHTPEPVPPTPGPPPPEIPPQPMPEPGMPPISDPIPPDVGEPIHDPGNPPPPIVAKHHCAGRSTLTPSARR